MATTRKTPGTGAKEDAATSTYTVLDALHHDGKPYTAGQPIELTEAQAGALPAGVVEPVKAEEA